jgi:hypothetical protein
MTNGPDEYDSDEAEERDDELSDMIDDDDYNSDNMGDEI